MKISEEQVDEHIAMIKRNTGKILAKAEGYESLYKLITVIAWMYLPQNIVERLDLKMETGFSKN